MTITTKVLWRAADRLSRLYRERRSGQWASCQTDFDAGLRHYFDRAGSWAGLMRTCADRGWAVAAEHCLEQHRASVAQLQAAITRQDAESEVRPLPSTADLFRELSSVQDEFGSLRIDPEGVIRARTRAIRLEGIELGSFDIRLQLGELNSDPDRWFDVEALDPNPSSADSTVTHPHVQGGYVCTGDAKAAVRNALLDGRLGDFFVLVRSVLEHYSPGSAYVSLGDWDGAPCSECGYVASELSYCSACDCDVCDECLRPPCCVCRDSLCRSCARSSDHSGRSVCHDCLESCQNCDQACASTELEDGLCPDCVQSANTAEDGSPDSNPTSEQETDHADHVQDS